jgi:hypothetical protein
MQTPLIEICDEHRSFYVTRTASERFAAYTLITLITTPPTQQKKKKKNSQNPKHENLIKIEGLLFIDCRNPLTSKEKSIKQEISPYFTIFNSDKSVLAE